MLRHIALSVLAVITGLILLLPGVCTLFFLSAGRVFSSDPAIVIYWIMSLLATAGGLWLIVTAFRRPN